MKLEKKTLSAQEVKDYYSNVSHSYSLEQQERVEALKEYFSLSISNSNEFVTDALPVIDITKGIIKEYQQIFTWVEEGFKKFIFKGSRGSGKSTFAGQFIVIDMLLDYRFNWIVIMENRTQHSDTTMQELKDQISEVDKSWEGFKSKWEFSDGSVKKEAVFRHNGKVQVVKFIGLEEAKRGTFKPPANYGVWRGFHIEEPATSDEAFGMNVEKKREKFAVLKTLRGSVMRYFIRLSKEEQQRINFLELWTFNPYNDEDPALDNFNKYHEDNKLELMKYGFTFKKQEELKEAYITSNYLVNPFLPPQFITDVIEPALRIGGNDEKVLVWGMTGSPTNSIYSNIFHLLDLNKVDRFMEKTPPCDQKGFTGFNNFLLNIDVGDGGDGAMAMGLTGELLDGTWIPLKEWTSNEWVKNNRFESDKLAVEMWVQIHKWTEYYIDINRLDTMTILMDNNPHFKAIFKRAQGVVALDWKLNFKLHLFKEKHLRVWKNEARPKVIKYLISSGIWKPYKALTPIYWKQLRSKKMGKNGKVMDGKDDVCDAFEMGLFFIAKEVGEKSFKEGKLLDKGMKEFINGL